MMLNSWTYLILIVKISTQSRCYNCMIELLISALSRLGCLSSQARAVPQFSYSCLLEL